MDTTSVFNLETTLNQRCTTSMQPFFKVEQRCFNNLLVIKNDPVKKATLFCAFMEGIQLSHDQVLVLEQNDPRQTYLHISAPTNLQYESQ